MFGRHSDLCISEMFNRLIETNELPKVEFHILWHLSTTVRLFISKGDVKSSGHSVSGSTGAVRGKACYASIIQIDILPCERSFCRAVLCNFKLHGS